MGLLKAVFSAVGSTMADQWKEFFYCEALPSNVLVTKGQKRVSAKSSNTKGSENIITNGSGIAVADGQCMIIVDNGKVVELCAEPGEYTYDTSTEPSIFSGSLGNSIKETFKTIGKRIGYGGDTGHDQRIYYFNLKEIMNNKFGTQNPVPFRVVDRNINLDIDISIRCNGEYTYRIADPMLFYANVCGNVAQSYTSDQIAATLKAEFLTALQPAFAQISAQGVRYSALPGYTQEITDAMNTALAQKWKEKRGIEIVSVMINSATASKEDEELIKQAQRAGMLQSPGMAAATLTAAQADAMKAAAGNSGGAALGFMNMNMAQQAGGMNAQALYQMHAQQQQTAPVYTSVPENADTWSCACGAKNTGKFCAECGKPKPVSNGWTCSCGQFNQGKFCAECGKPKPAGVKTYRCDKCGWKPADPTKPPRFCPECGDVFDANDEVTE
ncbi:MAG: SPFH domain-containing protein [Oscillospiraceae bacterium]|nr:SPFH domain-containing protein [Oscillospiraceae bacterium]